jgi:hypothetical protein
MSDYDIFVETLDGSDKGEVILASSHTILCGVAFATDAFTLYAVNPEETADELQPTNENLAEYAPGWSVTAESEDGSEQETVYGLTKEAALGYMVVVRTARTYAEAAALTIGLGKRTVTEGSTP